MGAIMENWKRKCPHCGRTFTLKEKGTAGFMFFPQHNESKRSSRRDPLPPLCHGSGLSVRVDPQLLEQERKAMDAFIEIIEAEQAELIEKKRDSVDE